MATIVVVEFQQTVLVEGEQLDIVVTEIDNNNWQLSIRNPFGIFTIWHHLFNTPEAAIDTALSAIKAEGVEEFLNIEGFEYLLDS